MTTYENIYISGPMRNHPAYNFPAFFLAEAELHEEYPEANIVNPARQDVERFGLEHMLEADPTGFLVGSYLMDTPGLFDHECLQEALSADLHFICKHADMIYLLPGWKDSTGAAAEIATARALGIYINYPEVADEPRMDLTAPIESTSITENESDRGAREVESRGLFGSPEREDLEFRDGLGNLIKTVTGEVRTVSATGGEKGVKLAAFDQISPEVLTLVAEHFGKGARKYSAHNFRKGYEWSKSFSALMRHLMAFWSGEEYDTCPADGYGCQIEHPKTGEDTRVKTEHGWTCYNHTGSLHIVAVIWHAMVLTEFYLHRKEYDDRYATTSKQQEASV